MAYLCLSRKPDEKIMVRIPGRKNPITVLVLSTDLARTRLAFNADPDIKIDREEIYRSKIAEKATQTPDGPELN